MGLREATKYLTSVVMETLRTTYCYKSETHATHFHLVAYRSISGKRFSFQVSHISGGHL